MQSMFKSVTVGILGGVAVTLCALALHGCATSAPGASAPVTSSAAGR